MGGCPPGCSDADGVEIWLEERILSFWSTGDGNDDHFKIRIANASGIDRNVLVFLEIDTSTLLQWISGIGYPSEVLSTTRLE